MRGGTCDAGVQVVLGQPEAVVAKVLGGYSKVNAVVQRVAGRLPGRDWTEIEY